MTFRLPYTANNSNYGLEASQSSVRQSISFINQIMNSLYRNRVQKAQENRRKKATIKLTEILGPVEVFDSDTFSQGFCTIYFGENMDDHNKSDAIQIMITDKYATITSTNISDKLLPVEEQQKLLGTLEYMARNQGAKKIALQGNNLGRQSGRLDLINEQVKQSMGYELNRNNDLGYVTANKYK
jgi:hypothetical protein